MYNPTFLSMACLTVMGTLLGLPSAQESQSELFRLLTGVSLHVLALETRCTTMPFLQAHIRIHDHSTIYVMLGDWKEVNNLKVVA